MRSGLAQPPQVGTICALDTKTHRLPERIKLRRGANAPEMFAGLPGSMLIVSIRFIFSHRCTLLAMNSEPLSLRRNSGAPCCSTAFCIRCFQCRIHHSAWHSRVYSSKIVSIFHVQPCTVASAIKAHVDA